jgi:hypothetical protein
MDLMTPLTDWFPESPRQIVEQSQIGKLVHLDLVPKLPLLIVLDFLEIQLYVGCEIVRQQE